jgi:hypothetical protein
VLAAFWQFAGSLAAIAGLIWLAFRFGAQEAPTLLDESEACSIANELSGGFEGEEIAFDLARKGALLRDRAGRIALVAPCGAHFLSRLLSGRSSVLRDGTCLIVRDGSLTATLDLGADAGDWERAINGLG